MELNENRLPGPISIIVKHLAFKYVHHHFHTELNAPPFLSASSPEHFGSDLMEDTHDLSLQLFN